MTPDERLANFGGAERVLLLRSLLLELVAADVTLYVVSIGYSTAFGPHLEEIGLLGPAEATMAGGAALTAAAADAPISRSRVFGQDSSELRALRFVKAALIGQIMRANGCAAQIQPTPNPDQVWAQPKPTLNPNATRNSPSSCAGPYSRSASPPQNSLTRPTPRWAFGETLFVDDSIEHIDRAGGTCRTLHVAHRGGMQRAEFDAIRAAAGLPREPNL